MNKNSLKKDSARKKKGPQNGSEKLQESPEKKSGDYNEAVFAKRPVIVPLKDLEKKSDIFFAC